MHSDAKASTCTLTMSANVVVGDFNAINDSCKVGAKIFYKQMTRNIMQAFLHKNVRSDEIAC